MRKNRVAGIALTLLLLATPGCALGVADSPAPSGSVATPMITPTLTPTPIPTPPPPTVSTLAVCGDVMSHMPVTNDAWDEGLGDYDYRPMLSGAEPLVAGADYAVANLETVLGGGPKYSGYPNFNSPDGLARDLKGMGFDLMLTANNHTMDQGFDGLVRTLDVLDEEGIAHVGTSRTQEEAEGDIVVADVGGISVAFLGYTYGTNGIPLPQDAPFAVNLFNTDYMTSCAQPDTARLLDGLERARALDTDLVAVMIHWGIEYKTKPSTYQQEIADLLIENGADLILGGHPHVLQPMEERTVTGEDGRAHSGFVSYSLGNFISSQPLPLTDVTAVLTLELTRDNVTGETALTDYEYTPLLRLRRGLVGDETFTLLDAQAALAAGERPADETEELVQAIADCHDILDPQRDAGAR